MTRLADDGREVTAEGEPPHPDAPVTELLDPHETDVGGMTVRRALPRRARRTVGPWCFLDAYGPSDLDGGPGMQVGPHPHIGLQTVTWLHEGEVLHTDSLGSEQPIRPGQLNLMTSGRGIAHAEVTTADNGPRIAGLQFWVALPEDRRHGEPAFDHHGELPVVDHGDASATVVMGTHHGVSSPAAAHSPMVGTEIHLRGPATIPLDPGFEHAVLAAEGAVTIDGTDVALGQLAYLGAGRDQIDLAGTDARLFLVGGEPWTEGISMWWNFVARNHDEIDQAREDWQAGSDRFGDVSSDLATIAAPRPPWRR